MLDGFQELGLAVGWWFFVMTGAAIVVLFLTSAGYLTFKMACRFMAYVLMSRYLKHSER